MMLVGRYTLPLLFSAFFLVSTLIDPLWFTNSKGYIDAWIYWGAGDKPSLSYQNDFASTYYLQRYIVILPKIITFYFFGSFWGQLVTGLFWISIAFYYLLRISRRYFGRWSAFLLMLLFMSDPVLLGAFGSSYTMGPAIAFYSMFFFYLTRISQSEEVRANTRSIFFTGIAVACLSNAYLLHGLITLGITFLYLFYLKAVSVSDFIKYFLASLIPVSVLFQAIYYFISGDWVPFILKQLRFGSSIAFTPNPYGSNGFTDFWGTVLSTELTYYWLIIVLSYISITFHVIVSKSFQFNVFKVLIFTTASLLFGYLSQTLLYTNIFGYIWVSSGLYMLKFLSLLFLALMFRSVVSERTLTLFLLIAVLFLLMIDFYSSYLAPAEIIRSGALVLCFLILSLVVSTLMTLFGTLRLSKYLSLGLASSLLILLPTYSHVQSFRQYAVPFEGTFKEAQEYYTQVTRQRSIVLRISQSIKPKPRSWFTPDSGVPLVSSQLYLYSLISSIPEKANCAQIDWARNYKSLIFSFGPRKLETLELSKMYLWECGYDASEVPLNPELAKDLANTGGQVWELIPKK